MERNWHTDYLSTPPFHGLLTPRMFLCSHIPRGQVTASLLHGSGPLSYVSPCTCFLSSLTPLLFSLISTALESIDSTEGLPSGFVLRHREMQPGGVSCPARQSWGGKEQRIDLNTNRPRSYCHILIFLFKSYLTASSFNLVRGHYLLCQERGSHPLLNKKRHRAPSGIASASNTGPPNDMESSPPALDVAPHNLEICLPLINSINTSYTKWQWKRKKKNIYNHLSHRHNKNSFQYPLSREGQEAIVDIITFSSHHSLICSNASTSWDSLSSVMTPPTCSSPTLHTSFI